MRVIEVIVKPQAGKTEIIKQSTNQLTIAVKAPPEEGKANKELLKFLSKTYHCIPEIISGYKKKKKLIRLSG